jgi:hypothetical protein
MPNDNKLIMFQLWSNVQKKIPFSGIKYQMGNSAGPGQSRQPGQAYTEVGSNIKQKAPSLFQ